MNIRKSDVIDRLARMEFSLIFALYKIFLEIFSNKFFRCFSSLKEQGRKSENIEKKETEVGLIMINKWYCAE